MLFFIQQYENHMIGRWAGKYPSDRSVTCHMLIHVSHNAQCIHHHPDASSSSYNYYYPRYHQLCVRDAAAHQGFDTSDASLVQPLCVPSRDSSSPTTAAKLPPAGRKRTNLACILRLWIPIMVFFMPFLGCITPVSWNTHHGQCSFNLVTPAPSREVFSPQPRPIPRGTEDREYLEQLEYTIYCRYVARRGPLPSRRPCKQKTESVTTPHCPITAGA